MTQEVQPLTWQKRTNIEEHQQFFAKINEIVGQLSGTVERSETALTEANTALANAWAAVATANTASAQATEAATTVAGYNTRLTDVEVQAAANKSDISQLDIETQDLYDRDAQSVKLAADHIQVITGGLDLRGTNRSPNTSVGADDTVIANGHRIVQELAAYGSTVDSKLNSYSSMVRTTGNQEIAGRKVFVGQPALTANQYPLYHCIVKAIKNGTVEEANASGMQFYDGTTPTAEYLGRMCVTYSTTTNKANMDYRVNSLNYPGNHARLYVEEKDDGTFALSFWNGSGWVRLVQ